MTQIKLCGLRRLSDIEAANSLKPEYVGFVFWEKSKRFVSRDTALELKKALLPEIKAVGVFVDEEPSVVAGLLRDGIIDMAQLHGKEDGEYVRKLRILYPKGKIIKAVKVKDRKTFLQELKWFDADDVLPDYYLFDSGTGSGQTFNWEIIRDWALPSGDGKRNCRGFFLAGGLDAGNVSYAIEAVRPMAVDVSSGIETDGVKDRDKMEAFVRKVRSKA